MKPLTKIEFCGMAIGVGLIVAGLIAVIWPQPGIVPHFTNDALGLSPQTEMKVMTKSGARVHGVIALLVGTGLTALSVYRGREFAERRFAL